MQSTADPAWDCEVVAGPLPFFSVEAFPNLDEQRRVYFSLPVATGALDPGLWRRRLPGGATELLQPQREWSSH